MKPTLKDVEYSPILSKLAVHYSNEDYIAETVLPTIQSKKLTGKYFKFGKERFRETDSHRGMGAPANEVGYGVTKSSAYSISDHALKQLVPDELVDQSPNPLKPSMDATENIVERLLIEKEVDLATYMKNTSNIGNNTTLSGTDQWSDYANSDPIGDLKTARQSIHGSIFQKANTLVLGQQTFDELVDHPDVIDRVKYSQFGSAAEDVLARLFKVENVLIGGAGYNTSTEGQTASMSYIWGKYAWMLYVPSKAQVRQVALGYHFQKDTPRTVDRWYNDDREGTFVRVHDKYTREFVDTDCAYLIKNAVA